MISSVFQRRRAQRSPRSALFSANRNAPRRHGRLIPVVSGAICLAPFTPLLLPDDRVIPDNLLCDYESYQLPV